MEMGVWKVTGRQSKLQKSKTRERCGGGVGTEEKNRKRSETNWQNQK